LPEILDPFHGLKIGVPSGCLGKTSIFKIIMIDDVCLWSTLESTWLGLLDFTNSISYRLAIFKMLALEQSMKKCPYSAGGGSSDRSDPSWLRAWDRVRSTG